MSVQDDRKTLKIAMISIFAFIIAFLGYLYIEGTKERAYSNVGKTIFIGDEYRYLAYKDKVELENKLKNLSITKGVKVLVYIIKLKKFVEKDGRLRHLYPVKENEMKIFIDAINGEVIFNTGEKVIQKFNKKKFEEFLDLSITQQINTDLYDTAIWDINDYLMKEVK